MSSSRRRRRGAGPAQSRTRTAVRRGGASSMPPWSLSVTGPLARPVGGPPLGGWVGRGGRGRRAAGGQVGAGGRGGGAVEGAGGLGADRERWRGEVGQRYLSQLDDLHSAGLGARRDRALACLVARLVEDRPPPSFPDVEDPVH